MPLSAWIMLALLAVMFVVLFVTDIPPAAVFLGVLTICLTFHLGPQAGLLSGFSNSSLLTVAVQGWFSAARGAATAVHRPVQWARAL
jgi:glucose-6-phosphate-specific signal transduction histidine kinase